MSARTDDGRDISFDLKDYDRIDHGYAATIHKAQGMTVDRTHVLATPGMDAHGSYVALSRHRDGLDLHYGRDDFADQNRLVRRSEEHTSELQSLMRISYAVFCLKKKTNKQTHMHINNTINNASI